LRTTSHSKLLVTDITINNRHNSYFQFRLFHKITITTPYINPALFSSASGFGFLPRKRVYKIKGSSVPPLERVGHLKIVRV